MEQHYEEQNLFRVESNGPGTLLLTVCVRTNSIANFATTSTGYRATKNRHRDWRSGKRSKQQADDLHAKRHGNDEHQYERGISVAVGRVSHS